MSREKNNLLPNIDFKNKGGAEGGGDKGKPLQDLSLEKLREHVNEVQQQNPDGAEAAKTMFKGKTGKSLGSLHPESKTD